MTNLKFDSNQTIYTFKVSNERHEIGHGAKPKLVDEGEIYKIHIPGNQNEFHGGFKKIMLEVKADENQSISQFYAVIDVYYVPPSYLLVENDAVKLARVVYSGNLSDASGSGGKGKWNTQIIVSSPFNEKNSDGLPLKVRQIGTGAFITAIVQSLFGTTEGIKLLNLEGYKIPDTNPGTTDIKITN